MKINDLLTQYYRSRRNEVASPETIERVLRPLKAFFKADTLETLTQIRVDEYIDARRNGQVKWPGQKQRHACGNGTIRRELGVLTAAQNWAYRANLIPASALRPISKPVEPPPTDRWLLRSEAVAYLTAAQGKSVRLTRAYRILAAALFTGARRRAIETLTWDRIHLNVANAQLCSEAIAAGNGPPPNLTYGWIDYRDPTIRQTKKRRARSPISPDMALVLLRAHKERISPFYADTTGGARTTLRTAARKAGLKDIDICHVLRHTFATWAAQDGVPMADIAYALGDTITTTEKRYAHMHPDYLRTLQSRSVMDMSQVIVPDKKAAKVKRKC